MHNSESQSPDPKVWTKCIFLGFTHDDSTHDDPENKHGSAREKVVRFISQLTGAYVNNNIYDRFLAKRDLDDSIFFSDERKQPITISGDIAEAAFGAAGGIALVIPVVGPALFAIGTLGSFLCRLGNLESPESTGPDRLTLLKTDILKSLKESKLNEYRGKLDALSHIIEKRASKSEDIFNRISSDDYIVVTKVYGILDENAFQAKGDQASLLDMLETLQKQYRWADKEIEEAIITLVPFLIQCMELRLVLSANLVAICEDIPGRENDAGRYIVDFRVDLDFITKTLEDTIKTLKVMIAGERKKRRDQFDGKVTQQQPRFFGDNELSWTFEDGYSGRKFKYSLHPQLSWDTQEVLDKMEAFVKELAAWYGQQLQAHCDRQFSVLEKVIERWEKVATALNDYWKTQPGDPGHPLDGRLMFRQMSSLVAQADKEAQEDAALKTHD